MESQGVFKWGDANTADLIVWRVSNSSLFTGKRHAAIKAFELYVKEKHLQGKVSPAWVRKKWENLRQKYKDLKSVSMMGGSASRTPWKWYGIMDQALSTEIQQNSYITPVYVSSSAQDSPPPVKQKKKEDWLTALREMEKRQEERERRAAEREEERDRRAAAREDERDRRAAEREEERDRQALEREQRREREMFAREERWEKEMLAREERQEREYKEREERREREAAAREERLFKLLETFIASK